MIKYFVFGSAKYLFHWIYSFFGIYVEIHKEPNVFKIYHTENGLKINQKCSFMTKNRAEDQQIDFKQTGNLFQIFYSMKIRR